jgi:hypothetical protein
VEWPDVVRAAIARCKEVGAETLLIDTLPQFAGLRGDAENNSGDIALGSESTVVAHETEQIILNQLLLTGGDAAELDTICSFAQPPLRRSNVQRALQELRDIRRVGKGKKKDPYRYYRQVEHSAQAQIL